GGAVIGSKEAIQLKTLQTQPMIFTAANTPGSVAAALEGIPMVREDPPMPARPRAAVDLLRGLRGGRGEPANPVESAIITIPLKRRDEVSAVVLARELLEAGVFVNPVVAPAVARGLGLLRLSVMLDHTPDILGEASESIFKVLADNDQLPD